MILSISRRTDIPAFYMEWLENRFKAGYVLVRNPMNYHQVSKVLLNPDIIDCIVFWTKNPAEFIKRINSFRDYKYYFQVSINPYSEVIEQNTPETGNVIESFIDLSERIGKNRVVWRYDPILISTEIDVNQHISQFNSMAEKLGGYTNKCVISFIDIYPGKKKKMEQLNIRSLNEHQMSQIGKGFSKPAAKFGFKIETCCEKVDLSRFSIEHTKCIDDVLISEIVGQRLNIPVDKNQRKGCGCVQSIDIGTYNSCPHDCVYCYANYSHALLKNNLKDHKVDSPMLIGYPEDGDRFTERKMVSYINKEISFGLD